MAFQANEAEAISAAEQIQTPVPAPRPRKTIVDISLFSGKETEDITEWMIRWDIAARANGWTEEHQIQILPAYLTGRAARIFWRIPQETREDIEELKEALEDYFNSEKKNIWPENSCKRYLRDLGNPW